jgi:hypothetical protein
MQKAQTISSLVLSPEKGNDKGTPTVAKVMIPVRRQSEGGTSYF